MQLAEAAWITSDHAVITLTFLPGNYPVDVIPSLAGRVIGNCTLRHVVRDPGTVTITAPPMQANREEVATYFTFTEDKYGVGTTFEMTGFNVSVPADHLFAIDFQGTNAMVNLTDCAFQGGGYYSRIALHVGLDDKRFLRPAAIVLTRVAIEDMQQDVTVFGLTSLDVNGGRSDRTYRFFNQLFRGEQGNVSISDWSATGHANSEAAIITMQNNVGNDGSRTPNFKIHGFTLRNVRVYEMNFGGPAIHLECGFVRMYNVSFENLIQYGGAMTNSKVLQRSLLQLWSDADVVIDGMRVLNTTLDVGIHEYISPGQITLRNLYWKGNTFSRCIDTLGTGNIAVNIMGSVFQNSDCSFEIGNTVVKIQDSLFKNITYVSTPLFDLQGSNYTFNNVTVSGSTVRNTLISVKDHGHLRLVDSNIENNYVYKSVLSTDATSNVDASGTLFKANMADWRDLISLNFAGTVSWFNMSFIGNRCLSAGLIRLPSGTTLNLRSANVAANAGSFSIASGGRLRVRGSTFRDNTPQSILASQGYLAISGSTFINNTGVAGGAVSHAPTKQDGYLVIDTTVFLGNNAEGDGGAIYVDSGSFDPIVFSNVAFVNNTAKRGGAVFQLQSIWANVGSNASALTSTSGNIAVWQGNDFATGLAEIIFVDATAINSTSGAYLPDIKVNALDAYHNMFRSPRTAMLKIALSLQGRGSLIGSTSAYILTGEAIFSRLQLYAPVGTQVLRVDPITVSYDPTKYHANASLITAPCIAKGWEEKVVDASAYAACIVSVCTSGCLSEYGYCHANLCICTAADREGINCGLKKGNRDVITLGLPNTWVPSSTNRDTLLASIGSTLGSAAKAEFRSFTTSIVPNTTDTTTLRRRDSPLNSFTFALLDPHGQYIEGTALESYQSSVALALDPVVGSSVTVNTVASSKLIVQSRSAISVLFIFLSAASMATAILFATFLIVYREDKAVKASSVLFSQQILLGVLMGYTLILLYVGQPTRATCTAQIWIAGLAFTLAVGNLIGKNYRIFKIFNTTGRAKAVKDQQVLMLVSGFMAIEIVIDAVWTGIAPAMPLLVDNDSGRSYVCSSNAGGNMPLTIVALVYKLMLLLIACTLAFLTRKVDGLYSESKAIGISSYTMLFSGAVIVPLVFLPQTTPTVAFCLKSVGILISGIVTSFSLFWPKLWTKVMKDMGLRSTARTTASQNRRKRSSIPSGPGTASPYTSQGTEQAEPFFSGTEPPTPADEKRVMYPAEVQLYVRKGLAGGFRQAEIFMDIESNIIFIRRLQSDEKSKVGISIRLEHMTRCSWDQNEKILYLQAGDNSLQIMFSSERVLRSYVAEIQARIAQAGGTGTMTAARPPSFMQSRPASMMA
ncbi:hypothetical protein HKX48_007302 [Thoreauomyces humboldtii]|nr:hypothetical protein HKX48_007302 [Thoreauomyces humboldtii]